MMKIFNALIVAFLTSHSVSAGKKLCFPDEFMFGVATAAYQIEGAWNESGKSESIWDHYTHLYPNRVADRTNADIADDSYHMFKEDVRMLKKIGAGFYRFSISWPRILPNGFSNEINKEGVDYYNSLITELLQEGILPLVTMYHWDLPQSLQDLGGWTNPIIADYFRDYAKVLFETFGDRVKNWLTFNEPTSFCLDGYGGGGDAPGGTGSGIEDYMCGHNFLRAHAMAYRLYETDFRDKQQGFVSVTLNLPWFEPNTTSAEDQKAADTARQFRLGWFVHPIFSEAGDYPPEMRSRIDEMSRRQNYPRSRLPHFTAEEIQSIRGSSDFLGLNHYTSQMVAHTKVKVDKKPSFWNDMGVNLFQKPNWPTSNSTWLKVVPWGFRKVLNYVKREYRDPTILITENGVSTQPGLHDLQRIHYMDSYLRNLHAAMTKDRVTVIAYTYWSLMDNYEWMRGHSERFGLFEVDYKSPKRTRTPRESAKYFEQLSTTRCIPSAVQFERFILRV